ncbi:MAG TPA: translation elongation factor 4 [Bdellovibrionota bacterium]|nr:translation elongation factor 4 [Bdellovibrionota bacterium]
MDTHLIRNFCIIAHIDHGKSTLADRILDLTGAITQREKKEQFLDSMELERERGITIKAQSVRLKYKSKDGQTYFINLIDTPGHVDFTYEVSKSLSACEGALLVVDAAQGVQAQTVANLYLAVDNNLTILPVLNKIDLPNANIEEVKLQLEELGINTDEALCVSAKTGEGVADILEAVIKKVPPPQNSSTNPLKALLFDSWFDNYKGVIVLIRVFEGQIKKGMYIKLTSGEQRYEVQEVGIFTPHPNIVNFLSAGEVGYAVCGIKDIHHTKIGDTMTDADNPCEKPLEGFKDVKPMVFSGFFPTSADQYENLRDALEKLKLNDYSFSYEPESSVALGFGFRCGFLGLLHMEIIQERLEREYNLSLIATAPSVVYNIVKTDGEILSIDNPALFPPVSHIQEIREPLVAIHIHTPHEYVGNLIKLCVDRRGLQKKIEYLSSKRVMLVFDMPFNEIIFDFYDKLKSLSQGYASLDYEIIGYQTSDLIKLDILINGKAVDALSVIVHREKAYYKGRELVKRMKEVIPRQMFEVAIQAAIGSKVISRETVKAFRKNVIAKCYGGDITRKRKLLEKQKEGKKKMKMIGAVEIPQEAFLAILKVGD